MRRAARCATCRPRCSPDASAEEADDVWSLCVVLHEAVSGRHPFADRGGDADVWHRIEQQRLSTDDSLPVRSGSASAVLAWTAGLLMASPSARPATARTFSDALDALMAPRQ